MEDLAVRSEGFARHAAQGALQGERARSRSEAIARSIEESVDTSAPRGNAPEGATADFEARLADIRELAAELERRFQGGPGIRFEVTPHEGEVVVQVVDRASDKVIRTIPSERLAGLRDQIAELRQGVLLDDSA